jgi:2'-5' RNA ligase
MRHPLILTSTLDAASQARFDEERQRYFPADRNWLHAHVTMFHALPDTEQPGIERTLAETCRAAAPCPFETAGLHFLGRGVAYKLHAPGLATLRAQLASHWHPWLTPQDRQKFNPHVTVQNKAAPADAKALLATLQDRYATWRGEIIGLALWRYEGGPWSALARWEFATSGIEDKKAVLF